MKFNKKLKWALSLALVMVLATTFVASAITIIIDGTREAAWDGGGSAPDDGGNEASIRDANDIDRLEFTNDTTYYYILLDTFANTIWNNTFGTDPSLYICMNVDNLPSGISGVSLCDNGNMTGIDYILEILGGPTLTLNIYNSSLTPVTDLGKQVSSANNITEIRITATAIGLDSSNCLTSMPTSIYFDNGVIDPEDNTPDNGTVSFGCGTPTAVTLTNIEGRNHMPIITVAAAVLLLIVSGGMILVFKRSRA